MKFVSKIFTFFLIGIVALGSVGVAVNEHFCHNDQEKISFFDFSANCSDDEIHDHVEELDACCELEVASCDFDDKCVEDCCTVDSKFFKVNFDYSEKSSKNIIAVVSSNPIIDFSKSKEIGNSHVAIPLPRPPDDTREVYLEEIQTYLI